jgi:ketosteroid isomerase-like protein
MEATRLFTEALNARDRDALLGLIADDVEFPTPEDRSLGGEAGLDAVLKAAKDTDLLLAREGAEQIDADSGVTRVTVNVRELIHHDEQHGTAEFAVRDGRIARFEVLRG